MAIAEEFGVTLTCLRLPHQLRSQNGTSAPGDHGGSKSAVSKRLRLRDRDGRLCDISRSHALNIDHGLRGCMRLGWQAQVSNIVAEVCCRGRQEMFCRGRLAASLRVYTNVGISGTVGRDRPPTKTQAAYTRCLV